MSTKLEVGDTVRTHDGFVGVIVETRATMPEMRRPFNYIVELDLSLNQDGEKVQWGFSFDEVSKVRA